MYANSEKEIKEFIGSLPHTRAAIYNDETGLVLTKKSKWFEPVYASEDIVSPIFISYYENGDCWGLIATFELSNNHICDIPISINWKENENLYLIQQDGVATEMEIGLVKGYLFEGLNLLVGVGSDADFYSSKISRAMTSENINCYLGKMHKPKNHPPVYCFTKTTKIEYQTLNIDEAEKYFEKVR
ncbi:hypothetical protein JCM30760_26760 [Thiomicrorhabdus hydrogeniphila]